MSFFVCLDVDMDSTSMTVFMLSPMQKPKIHRHTEHVKLCLHLSLLSDMHINYPCLHFAYKHIEKNIHEPENQNKLTVSSWKI